MRSSILHTLLLGSAYAAGLPELAIAKRSLTELGLATPARVKERRDGTDVTNAYSILTWSVGGAYYANVTIGTPPQAQVVILDTGSSDLYFDASTASACQNINAANSCRGGTFNPSNSKTYKIVDAAPAFDTAYGDGSTASGPFAIDTLGIGSVSIANVQFGVAEEVNSTTGYAVGLMGVGYSQNEATRIQYPNVPEVLKDAGVIESRLYSVYLNDANYGSGSILFGGVDSSKYTGDLVTLDLLPDEETGDIDQFITTVTALDISSGQTVISIMSGGKDGVSGYSNDNTLPVLLDTGSSAWTVPSDIYSAIVKEYTFVDKQGLCPCSYRDSGDQLLITFGGKQRISVPAQEFIIPIYNATTNRPIYYDNKGNLACAFMLGPGDYTKHQHFLTLGDAVLRSMYVVFDLDNGQVSLAQANVNSTSSSNIVKVGPNGVAAAVSGAYSVAQQTWSVAADVKVTQSFVASTAATAIGTATGVDAEPTDARASPATSSKSSAAGLMTPALNTDGILSMTIALVMGIAGAALLL